MEDKKIKYPFKNFVKNIIVGIILMLSVFFMVPIINSFSNNVAGDDVNAASTAKVRVYGYYDNDIREIESTNWWDPWPFYKTTKYQYNTIDNHDKQ